MSRIKRLLIFVLILSLSPLNIGCSNNKNESLKPEELMLKVQKNLSNAENVDATVKFNLTMISDSDEMNISVQSDLIAFTQPFKAKADTHIVMGALGSKDMISYLVEENSQYLLYTKMNDQWKKTELDKDLFSEKENNYLNQLSHALYVSNARSFKKVSSEKIDDKETFKLTGTITGKSVEKLMNQPNLYDQFPFDYDKSFLMNLKDMPAIVWIDANSLMPIRISIDLSNTLQGLMDSIMSLESNQKEASDSFGKINISKSTLLIEYNNIGATKDFELPKEIQKIK